MGYAGKTNEPLIIHTDGTDLDFMALCRELDRELDRQAGGLDSRVDYVGLCTLEGLEDAFVAYENGRTAGCAAFKEYAPQVAEIRRVFVVPEKRRGGVARRLLKALEDKARSRGFHTLILETGRSFVPAVGLYRRLGYEEIPNFWPFEQMAGSICLRKRLDVEPEGLAEPVPQPPVLPEPSPTACE